MAFKLGASDRYKWPVYADLIGEDGAQHQHVINLFYKRFGQNELISLLDRLANGELANEQLVHEVVVGWEDVLDVNDEPLEFTPENLAALMNTPPFGKEVIEQWYESHNGIVVKN